MGSLFGGKDGFPFSGEGWVPFFGGKMGSLFREKDGFPFSGERWDPFFGGKMGSFCEVIPETTFLPHLPRDRLQQIKPDLSVYAAPFFIPLWRQSSLLRCPAL